MQTKNSLVLLLALMLALAGCRAQAAAPDRTFTLRTGLAEGRLVYVGVGGEIEGLINPDLSVQAGDMVQINVLNGDGVSHDLALPTLGVQTALGMARDKMVNVTFKAGQSGVYPYICTVSGHRQAGMEGRLVVAP
ncbi:MAG: cupredoxin domain-containing protein [Caldilineaceae bacterium]|nr:cupredoxin domain-containing protein [Caldilineaceae bacterium]